VPALSSAKAQPERVELATYVHKGSALAESFRATLTSILFSGHNGNRPRMLVVTSANPGEGKTTVASNLAVAMAEIGQRVLLVDADLRKPRVHDIFGVANTYGLTDLLRNRTVDGDSLDEAIQEPTAVPGLSVLPSGPPTAAASNLLHSPALPELMKRFKGRFDMVLIDTPPMLQMPDARVAGRLADAVVLVVRADSTTRDAAVAARQRFADDSTRVLGTILNDWNPKKPGSGYSHYHAHAYHGHAEYYVKDGADGTR
jgi:capsular exopolysaccharide synthesis family protein